MDQPLPFEIPNVTVLLQPEEQVLEIPRHKVKNVKQLLKYLGIRECTALVARGRELLTPDRAVLPHDNLLVRKVEWDISRSASFRQTRQVSLRMHLTDLQIRV